ncbi:MAG: hypothetical protein KME35_01215 [Aphanocapsa sp. GSE-SYN-MK-11-07L]|jgi:molecular chaperone GrpE (heat shock protein)|nr:hypothetical protein [Aphanocapsa sp. GSE-SYN-MK-11-07L]
MTNPLLHAFFLGRATAEVLSEEVGHTLTNLLAEVGRFDAEQRERLRQFTTQVMERASQEASSAERSGVSAPATDLQATIDELRAEIARVRAELQNYRNRAT